MKRTFIHIAFVSLAPRGRPTFFDTVAATVAAAAATATASGCIFQFSPLNGANYIFFFSTVSFSPILLLCGFAYANGASLCVCVCIDANDDDETCAV